MRRFARVAAALHVEQLPHRKSGAAKITSSAYDFGRKFFLGYGMTVLSVRALSTIGWTAKKNPSAEHIDSMEMHEAVTQILHYVKNIDKNLKTLLVHYNLPVSVAPTRPLLPEKQPSLPPPAD